MRPLLKSDHWVACSAREFGDIGLTRHIARRGAITTVCGATASHPEIWIGDAKKPRCSQCMRLYGKAEIL